MQEAIFSSSPIPALAGIGLRAEHYQDIIDTQPNIAWFEIHSENYFGQGGRSLYYLEKIRRNYPISFHGVGLSLGSTDALDFQRLAKLKKLIDYFEPTLVSEHLCWSSINGRYLNDLLPLPYTLESLNLVIEKIQQLQDYLQRTILIENIPSYLQFNHNTIPENKFISEVAQVTGCGILLDISNLYINSVNHGWDTTAYLQGISTSLVKEIHLAGFTENCVANTSILIDTHNMPIDQAVWELYKQSVQCFGAIPTLIEWDKDLPPLAVLLQESQKANHIMEKICAVTA